MQPHLNYSMNIFLIDINLHSVYTNTALQYNAILIVLFRWNILNRLELGRHAGFAPAFWGMPRALNPLPLLFSQSQRRLASRVVNPRRGRRARRSFPRGIWIFLAFSFGVFFLSDVFLFSPFYKTSLHPLLMPSCSLPSHLLTTSSLHIPARMSIWDGGVQESP